MIRKYKKILILISTFALIFAFVTYQPKKVDAFVSTATKFVAQKVLQATTKTAVDKTISKMLVDEVLDEVKKDYAIKNGYKLIENAGQKVLVKSSLGSAEKKMLKNEIDEVIEKQVYGNAPGWAKFLDWFVGVGVVIQLGQVLYATINGDFGKYLTDIINEAMINLGWLIPAPKIVDGKEPKPDPITFPTDKVGNVTEVGEYSYFRQLQYNDPSKFNNEIIMQDIPRVPMKNFVISAEMTSEKLPTVPVGSGIPNDNIMGIFHGLFLQTTDNKFYYSNEASPINITTLTDQKRIQFYSSALGRDVTVKYGNTVLYDSYVSNLPVYIDLPSNFDIRNYNKVIYQPIGLDSDTGLAITRYYLMSTIGLQPTLSYVATKDSVAGTDSIIKSATFRYRIPYISLENTHTTKVGIFSSLDLAWSADALPRPKMSSQYFDTPILDPATNKVAIPQKSVLPEGYTYDPTDQVIKSPSGEPVDDVTTIPEFTPDPVVKPSPDGTVIVDDVPTDTPVPPDGITPDEPADPSGGIEGGTPDDIEWEKLKAIPAIFTKKFPFSLPWDAKRFMEGVFGDMPPETSEFIIKIDELLDVEFGLEITIPDYFDPFFDFSRTATVILFDLGLIYGLYRLLGGAS